MQRVKLLLCKGADVNATDNGGRRAVHEASYAGELEVLQVLLDKIFHWADANARDREGVSALDDASYRGHLSAVKLLLDRGGDSVTTADLTTALRSACDMGHVQVIDLLLKRGASSGNMLIAACKSGRMLVVQLLLDGGCAIDVLTDNKWSPLHWASFQGASEVASLLLARGVNVNARTDKGATPLHHAIKQKRLEMVRLLFDNYADANARDASGLTCFELADRMGGGLLSKVMSISRESTWNRRKAFATFAVCCRGADELEGPGRAVAAVLTNPDLTRYITAFV